MYNSHCEGLGRPLHDHIATTYGVVCNSALNACRYFHVTSGMVPDIMHDILEGSLELCMQHLLIHLIHEQKLFSVVTLNGRISLHELRALRGEEQTNSNCTSFSIIRRHLKPMWYVIQ